MNLPHAILVAIAFGMLAAAGTAAAQYPGGGGTGGRPGPGGMGSRGGNPERAAGPQVPTSTSEVVQFRLNDLREDLKLTSAQIPAWTAYADKVTKLLGDLSRADDRLTRGDLNGPQRLDRLADVARNRATAVEEIAEAGKALYAQLAPEQRAVADARLAIVVLPVLGSAGSAAGGERRGSPPPPPRQ